MAPHLFTKQPIFCSNVPLICGIDSRRATDLNFSNIAKNQVSRK